MVLECFHLLTLSIMDGCRGVYILNDEWKFISSKSFYRPLFMISINNSIYMTGRDNVWKIDNDLNILINFSPGGNPNYGGISYNTSNGLIYVAAANLQEIQVFNLDLTLIRRFNTYPHWVWSITESSNQIYLGTGAETIVYLNE